MLTEVAAVVDDVWEFGVVGVEAEDTASACEEPELADSALGSVCGVFTTSTGSVVVPDSLDSAGVSVDEGAAPPLLVCAPPLLLIVTPPPSSVEDPVAPDAVVDSAASVLLLEGVDPVPLDDDSPLAVVVSFSAPPSVVEAVDPAVDSPAGEEVELDELAVDDCDEAPVVSAAAVPYPVATAVTSHAATAILPKPPNLTNLTARADILGDEPAPSDAGDVTARRGLTRDGLVMRWLRCQGDRADERDLRHCTCVQCCTVHTYSGFA